jgi:hypothetical protein
MTSRIRSDIRRKIRLSALIPIMGAALALTACASTSDVEKAQHTADQAMSTAQQAQATAQQADQKADQALSQIQQMQQQQREMPPPGHRGPRG